MGIREVGGRHPRAGAGGGRGGLGAAGRAMAESVKLAQDGGQRLRQKQTTERGVSRVREAAQPSARGARGCAGGRSPASSPLDNPSQMSPRWSAKDTRRLDQCATASLRAAAGGLGGGGKRAGRRGPGPAGRLRGAWGRWECGVRGDMPEDGEAVPVVARRPPKRLAVVHVWGERGGERSVGAEGGHKTALVPEKQFVCPRRVVRGEFGEHLRTARLRQHQMRREPVPRS